jgi:hypothetical protein
VTDIKINDRVLNLSCVSAGIMTVTLAVPDWIEASSGSGCTHGSIKSEWARVPDGVTVRDPPELIRSAPVSAAQVHVDAQKLYWWAVDSLAWLPGPQHAGICARLAARMNAAAANAWRERQDRS